MAAPFATVVIAHLFAWFGCIYSSDVVAENNFTFLKSLKKDGRYAKEVIFKLQY